MNFPSNIDIVKVLKKRYPFLTVVLHSGGIPGNGYGFVRDAHGIRPCYYYINDDVIVAASERGGYPYSLQLRKRSGKSMPECTHRKC